VLDHLLVLEDLVGEVHHQEDQREDRHEHREVLDYQFGPSETVDDGEDEDGEVDERGPGGDDEEQGEEDQPAEEEADAHEDRRELVLVVVPVVENELVDLRRALSHHELHAEFV
jgi:hypothetical protein